MGRFWRDLGIAALGAVLGYVIICTVVWGFPSLATLAA